MSEPTIICPNCKTEIKLTESLAAPLIESTRRDYEKRLALKDTDIAKKEETLREREAAVSKAMQAIDDQVAEKLLLECARIVAEGQGKEGHNQAMGQARGTDRAGNERDGWHVRGSTSDRRPVAARNSRARTHSTGI